MLSYKIITTLLIHAKLVGILSFAFWLYRLASNINLRSHSLEGLYHQPLVADVSIESGSGPCRLDY